jgi:2-keto-3-deoxy-L-rhamnonate aldolase RhmA
MEATMTKAGLFKEKLHRGEVCIGSWVTFTDPTATEIMCGSGYDFLILEAEHSPHTVENVQLHAMATKGTNTVLIVRVPFNEPVIIKRVLDVGAHGILVPLVKSAEEARQAVSYCMYPPEGMRGFGPRRPANYEREFKDYIARANKEMLVFAMIEDIQAVRGIDAIVQVPGLDGLLIGGCDLSASLGILGRTGDPRVVEAMETVVAKARQAGMACGLPAPVDVDVAMKWIQKGATFMPIGADMTYLVNSSDRTAAALRARVQNKAG